nr:uncharacterized protein LOC111997457 [Quercus suber]
MTETRAAAMNTVNEAIASLRTSSNHHNKDIQEMQTIQSIHTRTVNEMNQNINSMTQNINIILQKLNSIDVNQDPPQRNVQSNSIPSSSTSSFAKSVRLDFPRFSSSDPANWVYKANQYFVYYQTPITEKLLIASFHMDLEALVWFQEAEEARVFTDWESFVPALHVRFGTSAYDDPMEVLTRMRQTSTVAVYKAEFEAVSNRVKGLSPLHKLSCFLSALRDEIRLPVRMPNPQSLNEAFGLAKIQEEYVWSSRKSTRNHQEPGNTSILGLPKNNVVLDNKPKVPVKRLTPAQMDDRRKKGLCYNYDEKWGPGHKCKSVKLFLLEGIDIISKVQSRVHITEIDEEFCSNKLIEQEEDVGITLYALTGTPTPGTMRVRGRIKGSGLVLLVDTSSTHNFVDALMVSSLKLRIDTSRILEVKVANGNVVRTQGFCSSVPVCIQGVEFGVQFHVLTLGGCDAVLGTQWLSTLGIIQWDFQLLTMKIHYKDQQVLLQGLSPSSGTSFIDYHQLLKGSVRKGLLLQIDSAAEGVLEESVPAEVKLLLQEFGRMFETPTGLPPMRGHEHQITLMEVRKVDGSWRMCIDYRALNNITIKDKFPIPVIDELLDELNGATVFSKPDLRSGYHQIRMKEKDVPKTAFRTHEGHYEFLVMPFEMLALHKLYAKKSKCKFACKEVEYLEHVITSAGVHIDPKKTEAIQQWSTPTDLKSLRGFLGLTGYYRKFVKGYGQIAAPLTALLKKDAFSWTEEAEAAFQRLKAAMVQPPVLALPNFDMPFVIECDASGKGLGAVLMQQGRPIAFHSQALKGRNLDLSTYEKELLALVVAIKRKVNPGDDLTTAAPSIEVGSDHLTLETNLDSQEGVACMISFPSPTWLSDLKASYATDQQVQGIIQALGSGQVHDSPLGGHSSFLKTLHRVKRDFHWPGLRTDVRKLVRECDICQRLKYETCNPAGLLQPLPIPEKPWMDVSMDFVEGLPKSQFKDVVLVVVYRFTKFVYFVPLSHPYTAAKVAQLYMQYVFKLHGLPATITNHNLGWSGYHWKNFGSIPIFMTPFEALYGFPPPRLLDYIPGTTKVESVEEHLRDRQQLIALLKQNLVAAQVRMKVTADKHRTMREFEVGDWVYLKLHPYKQMSLRQKRLGKLSPRFYGPFQILQRIGTVSYKLDLPPESRLHPTFHVSCLKQRLGQHVVPLPSLPPVDSEGILKPEPVVVL